MSKYLHITNHYIEEELSLSDLPKDGPIIIYEKNIDKLHVVKKYISQTNDFVDLGLPSGLKWATCNVGATKPEEFGLYFAWGETQGYMNLNGERPFNNETYKFKTETSDNADSYRYAKYDKTDGLITLQMCDDGATAVNNNCRMPRREEIEELINNTYCEQVENYKGSNICGCILISKINKQEIFIPTLSMDTSFCVLWSSSLCKENGHHAYVFWYYLPSNEKQAIIDSYGRHRGAPIRAVKE